MKLTLYFPETFPDDFLAGHARELDTDAHESGYEYIIGRHPSSDIRIKNKEVSSRHAAISYSHAAESWFIQDLGSTNGTYMNRERLAPKDWVPLPLDSNFCLANSSLKIFVIEDADDTLGAEEETLVDAPLPVPVARTYADSLYLAMEWLVSGRTLAGKIWRVVAASLVVGTAIVAWAAVK